MSAWASRRSGIVVLALAGALAAGCEHEPRGAQTQSADSAVQLHDADAALKATYEKIAQRLGEEDKQRLLESEQAWLTYRDTNCDAEKAFHAGKVEEPMIEAACLAELTAARRAELARVYKDQLGRD